MIVFRFANSLIKQVSSPSVSQSVSPSSSKGTVERSFCLASVALFSNLAIANRGSCLVVRRALALQSHTSETIL
jgi:hypothetical protein